MSIEYNSSFRAFRTAKELITTHPEYIGKDGLYMLYPGGPNDPSSRQLVYCDMTTDGGGWMLIARSHPTAVNYNGKNWGWLGGKIGNVLDFTSAYQAGWYDHWHNNDLTFDQFIFGNRSNINNNEWGSFVYKRYDISYVALMTNDSLQYAPTQVLKTDTSVYHSTEFPQMQIYYGYAQTATSYNNYFMRDCCGPDPNGCGGNPLYLRSIYCGHDVDDGLKHYAGPWCGPHGETDSSGNFLSGSYLTSINSIRYGGTDQYMIMVR